MGAVSRDIRQAGLGSSIGKLAQVLTSELAFNLRAVLPIFRRVKTFIGQRGRDRVLHVWVESHGRRSAMQGDDVAGRILADVFGQRLIEDDYWCYQTFRDEFIAPRLEEADWSLTEAEVRDWQAAYSEQASKKRPRQQSHGDDQPESESPAEPSGNAEAESEPSGQASAEAAQEPVRELAADALVSWPSGITRAQVLRLTTSVMLLEGERPPGAPPVAGVSLRVGLPGLPRMIPARLAALGQGQRYLIALGSRAVRGALRVRVDVAGIMRTASQPAPTSVRILDLSSSGARLRGARLPTGSECELSFVPPGRSDAVRLRCVVVRTVEDEDNWDLGLAFCGGTLSFKMELTRPGRRTNG
jgi:hypothetical protein